MRWVWLYLPRARTLHDVLDRAGGEWFVFADPGGEQGLAGVGVRGEALFGEQDEALYQAPEFR